MKKENVIYLSDKINRGTCPEIHYKELISLAESLERKEEIKRLFNTKGLSDREYESLSEEYDLILMFLEFYEEEFNLTYNDIIPCQSNGIQRIEFYHEEIDKDFPY